MMLEDRSFLDKVRERIDDGFAAETALQHVVQDTLGAFARMTDRYLRERSTDVKDIGQRAPPQPARRRGRGARARREAACSSPTS